MANKIPINKNKKALGKITDLQFFSSVYLVVAKPFVEVVLKIVSGHLDKYGLFLKSQHVDKSCLRDVWEVLGDKTADNADDTVC